MTDKDRAAKRREQKAQRRAASRTKVYIPIPEEFLDVEGEAWTLNVRGGGDDLDLAEVIAHTVRRCPVKTGEDAERTLNIFMAIRDRDENDPDYIEMAKGDFQWMIDHFKEVAHQFWLAPDARYLIRYLEEIKMTRPPEKEAEPAAAA